MTLLSLKGFAYLSKTGRSFCAGKGIFVQNQYRALSVQTDIGFPLQ
jgi:hypothetical protein